jgi:hypothetical protein
MGKGSGVNRECGREPSPFGYPEANGNRIKA